MLQVQKCRSAPRVRAQLRVFCAGGIEQQASGEEVRVHVLYACRRSCVRRVCRLPCRVSLIGAGGSVRPSRRLAHHAARQNLPAARPPQRPPAQEAPPAPRLAWCGIPRAVAPVRLPRNSGVASHSVAAVARGARQWRVLCAAALLGSVMAHRRCMEAKHRWHTEYKWCMEGGEEKAKRCACSTPSPSLLCVKASPAERPTPVVASHHGAPRNARAHMFRRCAATARCKRCCPPVCHAARERRTYSVQVGSRRVARWCGEVGPPVGRQQ